ncbi:hypothetical protein INT45_012905 [Circinella minor]|uniref:Uncharacterized protein n=1 Tax=Circinella minor TaxID=1195481 RepID=A0A8H7S744_9FUNG|nr:hypothetical protein INT45_012905 [Circinella minor]
MGKSNAIVKKAEQKASKKNKSINAFDISSSPPSPTGAVMGQKIVRRKVSKKVIKKKNEKKRVKGASELDNPKYANKDFMLEMIEKASGKEEEREATKLARREAVEKKIKERGDKKEKIEDP